MILEELYEKIKEKINKYSIDRVINDIMLLEIDQIESIVEYTDQKILDFIKTKSDYPCKEDVMFDTYTKLKLEVSIKNMEKVSDDDKTNESVNELNEMITREIFSNILKPDNVSINDKVVQITYNVEETSAFMKIILKNKEFRKECVVDTISSKFKIESENVILVESVEEYIKFISTFEEDAYISRGQKDCTYDLVPSLYRVFDSDYPRHSTEYESMFKQRIVYYDDKIQNKNENEIKAYAQHYGLPTNYLDFTEAHLISLLFSVEEYNYDENHSIVFFVDALKYNNKMIKVYKKFVDFSDENIKKATEKEYSDKSYFICVGNSNERIHFQKGCFLKFVKSEDLTFMFESCTKVAIIEKTKKKEILKQLFNLGITFENIYPDKDNMVKTIRFIKEQR